MLRPIYLDECVNVDVVDPVRNRGVSITTASEQRTLGFDDESQLLFATRRGFILVTHNQRHFYRLHAEFLSQGRSHAGIILIPQVSPALLALRIPMLVAWIDAWATVENQLVRWHDLQVELIRGLRLFGFTEIEVRQALAIDPIET
jgi:hypothetical protein